MDYYLVKSGRYDVQSFFTPDGIYGRIQWWACICYVITLAVQVPFLDQLFYVGPLVSSLGGADISWIVGFGVASLLYLAGAKRFVPGPPGAAAAVGAGVVGFMRRRGELVAVAFDNLTLSQRVYEHLRDEILADHLLPGTELSEVALSKELAISRGPIREAMGRLAAEGLITMRPRRRAEVRSLTPQELIDAYQVREALEVMAVRLLIPRVTEADLARLEELIDQMAAHSAEGAVREFFTANVSFHELLCELSGNPKLQEVHHRLEGEIGRFQNRTLALRGSMDDSLTEHRAILAAIRLRDADRAAALTAEHIRVPAQRLQAALRTRGLGSAAPGAGARRSGGSGGVGAGSGGPDSEPAGCRVADFPVTRAGAILAVSRRLTRCPGGFSGCGVLPTFRRTPHS